MVPETDDPKDKLPSSVNKNLGAIAEFYARNEEKMSPAQAAVERISLFLGSPGYVVGNVVLVVCWIAWNLVAPKVGFRQLDEPPFFWLQGLVGLNAFIISTTVLIRQNRISKLAQHNAHLDLQVSLLAEEKNSKIIQMLEELRRDLPNIPNKPDSQTDELSHPADTRAVLSVIEREKN